MLDLSVHISALLRNYDCVIIPGFGGFVANFSPSYLDRKKGILFPPSKGIIFNKNLNRNDGLLANEIAKSMSISYTHAVELLNEFVNHLQLQLKNGIRFELNGIGFIYLDNEKNLQFKSFQTLNFLSDSFGLFPVQAIPIIKHEEEKITIEKNNVVTEPEKEKVKTEEKTPKIVPLIPEKKIKEKSSRKYYWAAAVILPLIFYSLWIPLKTPYLTTGRFDISYFNPFTTFEIPKYNQRVDEFNMLTELQIDSLLIKDEIEIEIPVENNVAESTDVAEPIINNGMHYHVIAGCFMDYNNAIGQITELKAQGIEAYQIGQASGFYRVALGSFQTKEEAVEKLNTCRNNGQPKAWLLEE